MKKYILLICLFSAINISLKAQGFNKIFFIDTCNTVVVSMKIVNHSIYVGGYMADYTKYNNGIQSFIAKYDLNGNKISQVKLSDNKYWQWWFESNIELNNNNELLFSCTVQDTSSIGHYSLLVIKMDTNLTPITITKIDTSKYLNFYGYNVINDKKTNNIFVSGQLQYPNQYTNPFLLKLDEQLQLKKFSIYTQYPLYDYFIGGILQSDTIILSHYGINLKYATDPVCQISHYSTFTKYDTNCNFVSRSPVDDTNAITFGSIAKINTNYFTCGSYLSQRFCAGQVNYYSSAIYKWDKDFKLLWKQYYGDTLEGYGLNKVKKAPFENNIITVGSEIIGDDNNYLTWFKNGCVIKYEESGNRQWSRSYRGYTDTSRYQGFFSYNEVNNLLDFDFLPDGSIIACGNVEMNEADSISQQGWLLRLRPDGCLTTTDCGVNGIEKAPITNQENKRLNIEIYPNPTTDNITINIEGFDEYPLKMNLFDIVGNKVKTIQLTKNAEVINLKELSQGNYIAVTSKNNKVIAVNKVMLMK